jgi:hypothetical protein
VETLLGVDIKRCRGNRRGVGIGDITEVHTDILIGKGVGGVVGHGRGGNRING